MGKMNSNHSPLWALLAFIVAAVVIAVSVWVVINQKPSTPNSLKITEWNMTIPLTSDISDAYYKYYTSDDSVYLTTTKLEDARKQITGCTARMHGLYVVRVGNALKEQSRIEPLCVTNISGASSAIQRIQTSLRVAISKAHM